MVGVKIRGDFARLKQLIKRVEGVEDKALLRQMRTQVSRGVKALILEGFDQARAPWGQRWKPTRDGGKPLVETGALRGSFTVKTSGSAIVVSNKVPYAAVHQEGATIKRRRGRALRRPIRIPRRAFLPTRPILPPHWEGRLRPLVQRLLARHMGR